MGIGTIIAGLNALGSLFNQPVELTPAQAEEKPKRGQAPMMTPVVVLPVPPVMSYWDELPPANVLRNPVWRMPQMPFGVPVFRGVPMTTYFPDFRPEPSLEELYQLYFGTRR